jgi:hypothetical protein
MLLVLIKLLKTVWLLPKLLPRLSQFRLQLGKEH